MKKESGTCKKYANSCVTIAESKGIKLYPFDYFDKNLYPLGFFDRNRNKYPALFPTKYIELKKDIAYYNSVLKRYTSHNMMIIDRYLVLQDYLSEEVLIGTYDYSPIRCRSYNVWINEKKQVYGVAKYYNIPLNKVVNIRFQKYLFGNTSQKIDTITYTRKFHLSP